MKKSKWYFLISIFISTLILLGCQNETLTPTESYGVLDKISGVEGNGGGSGFELSEEERDGLIHMRIEEKLARDVYIVMGELWNQKVFMNIQLSEQTHMDAIKSKLDKYNIPDPLTTDSVGVFPDPQFQQLYDQLILQGNQSLQEALLVGKTIEELDIVDLEDQLSFVDNPDIIRVYENLKAASENHLNAFTKCINIPVSE